MYRFFKLQENHPIKGDWVSTCLRDLTELRISESIEEIKNMPRKIFKNLIKSRILENALEYLNRKRGSKGQEIKYNTSLAAKGALAHRLHRRTACKIRNGRQGAPKWLTGSGKVSTPGILGVLSNF